MQLVSKMMLVPYDKTLLEKSINNTKETEIILKSKKLGNTEKLEKYRSNIKRQQNVGEKKIKQASKKDASSGTDEQTAPSTPTPPPQAQSEANKESHTALSKQDDKPVVIELKTPEKATKGVGTQTFIMNRTLAHAKKRKLVDNVEEEEDEEEEADEEDEANQMEVSFPRVFIPANHHQPSRQHFDLSLKNTQREKLQRLGRQSIVSDGYNPIDPIYDQEDFGETNSKRIIDRKTVFPTKTARLRSADQWKRFV